jgi:DNA-binding GntR family transcriptional regulator
MPDTFDDWITRYQQARSAARTDLTRSQADVLRALRTYQPPPGGPVRPSRAELAHVVGCSITTIRRALVALRAAGRLPR